MSINNLRLCEHRLSVRLSVCGPIPRRRRRSFICSSRAPLGTLARSASVCAPRSRGRARRSERTSEWSSQSSERRRRRRRGRHTEDLTQSDPELRSECASKNSKQMNLNCLCGLCGRPNYGETRNKSKKTTDKKKKKKRSNQSPVQSTAATDRK